MATTGCPTTRKPDEEVVLHCGGALAWRKGRIDYVDIYGPKEPVATWDERDYSDLKPTLGASRRMPSIVVKYNYDATAEKFLNEVTFNDQNALMGWGRANLFDIASLSDELCRWNDFAEAKHLGEKMLRAWSTGVRLWKVKLVHPWPWIDFGDGVTVSTDVYTDRRMDFSGDGLNDRGTPVKGRVSALGVVVAKNLLGTEFTLAVRGLGDIAMPIPPSDGTVDPPHADPTYDTEVREATRIVYPFTYDLDTAYIEVWSTEYASDPGAVVSRELVGTKVDIIRRGDGRTSIALSLSAATNWRLTTFVAFGGRFRTNERGTTVTKKTQGQAAAAPGAPGTPTAVSNTTTSVTNRVPTNASSTTAWKIRVYRNGVQWGSDINVAVGGGANQDVTHSGLDVGTSYTWEYSHVDGGGVEGAKSASLTHATASGGTLSAPTLDSCTRVVDNIQVSWTPAPGTPGGVTYKVYDASVSGGPYTLRKSTTSTSTSFLTGHNPAYVVVTATKAGYTDSPNSNQRSA